jgi:hypothetical protein
MELSADIISVPGICGKVLLPVTNTGLYNTMRRLTDKTHVRVKEFNETVFRNFNYLAY